MKKISLFLLLVPGLYAAAQQQALPTRPSPSDTVWVAKITKNDADWKKLLDANRYTIARKEGTENAFTEGNYNDNHAKGMYYCYCCHNPLFSSARKFDSGTGWPSFWQAYSTKSIVLLQDTSYGMTRDAVSCARCGAHLGHVFNDGPEPTGLRYCMNGLVLLFQKTNP